jgi:regulator of protease activity HflC (stomatin/prohibitin superfamily)
MPAHDIEERTISATPGFFALFLSLLALAGAVAALISAQRIVGPVAENGWPLPALLLVLAAPLLLLATGLLWRGLFTVQPNQAVALTLFGRYVGTVRVEGLRCANPFLTKRRISLRIRNFDTDRLKVNELDGSPIEIGAIVVWRVVDSAKALFAVDDYDAFVRTQSESALRQMATSYPYDGHDDPKRIALKSHSDEVSERLRAEIQVRLGHAGVEIVEARVSHLAYAPEIAAAMLRRQQASAIIAARSQIVEGAVGMVESALSQLADRGVLELDAERRAQMAGNLLVVLCSDQASQPVVNAGSLY